MDLIFDIDVPAEININMYRGDDRKFTVFVKDVNGDPYNIAGATAITYTVKDEVDGTEIFKVELGSGITVVGGVGEFELSIVSAKTLNVEPCVYEHDIEYNDPTSGKKTIMRGKLRISGDITT
jgi:hypothetical protein